MSTVLRPVGPHEARVYWIRRAVLVGLVVVIVVVLITALSGGSSKKPAARHTPTPNPSTSSPPATTQVAACDPSVIKLVLSTGDDTYTTGESVSLSGRFTNPGAAPCTLETSPAHETWTVTSGADKIWTTKGCTKTTTSKQIKIKAGGSKTISLAWNGHRLDSSCNSGSAALAGEYVLRATLDGVKGQPAVFHVTS